MLIPKILTLLISSFISIMKKLHLTLSGKLTDPGFEQCKAALSFIKQQNYLAQVVVNSFFRTDWEEYLKQIQKSKGGKFKFHEKSPLIFLNDTEYIGGAKDFLAWAEEHYNYHDNTDHEVYINNIQQSLQKLTIDNPFRSYCFMDIQIGQAEPACVIFELFIDVAPITCKNFIELCKGFKGKKDKRIGYSGSEFHRVVPNVFIQGGKIGKNKGKKKSFYGGSFADETFAIKHDQVGILGMAKQNDMPHTNICQFYVTLAAPLTYMDKKYVAFGRVIQGLGVFREIEKSVLPNQRPAEKCTIIACGLYHHGEQTAFGEDDTIEDIKEQGGNGPSREEDQADQIVEEANDDITTLDKFRKTFATIYKYLINEELLNKFAEKKFTAMDLDHNGSISFSEMWEYMKNSLKKKGMPEPSKKQIGILMKRYDKDENGVLTPNEFPPFVADLFKSSRQTLIVQYAEVKANDIIVKLPEAIKGNPKGITDIEEMLEEPRQFYTELRKCALQFNKAASKELTVEDLVKINGALCEKFGAPAISKEDTEDILKDVSVTDSMTVFNQSDLRIITVVLINVSKALLKIATNS